HATGDEGARVVGEVRSIMRGRTRAEWIEHFAGADICLTPVYTPDEVARHPHVAAPRVGLKPDTTDATAPALGADTDAVLEEAGIGQEERARLRRSGVI